MGAYSYLETDEWTGGIVFAKSNIEARKAGANLLDRDGIAGMEVKRRKDLDKFEATGVPAWILVSDGWNFECFGCGYRIEDWRMDEDGLPVTGVVGFEGGRIFCCHACRMEHLADRAAKEAFGNAFCDMLKDIVRARLPHIDPCFGEFQTYAYPQGQGGVYVVKYAQVKFRFPGMKIGPATIEYRHEGRYGAPLIGPVRPEFHCCNGDREAFENLFAPPEAPDMTRPGDVIHET